MKSNGINPMAPTTPLMSPKNGNMEAKNPHNIMYKDLRIILGIKFLLEKIPFFTSADFVSMISYAT